MLLSWVALQMYHVAWRVNNEARVEQELLDMGSSE